MSPTPHMVSPRALSSGSLFSSAHPVAPKPSRCLAAFSIFAGLLGVNLAIELWQAPRTGRSSSASPHRRCGIHMPAVSAVGRPGKDRARWIDVGGGQ
jgi:hypothetical protein